MQVPFIWLPHPEKLAAAPPAMQIVTSPDLGTLVVSPFPPFVKAWGIICCVTHKGYSSPETITGFPWPQCCRQKCCQLVGHKPEFRLAEVLMWEVIHFIQHCSRAPARGSSPCRPGQGSAVPHVNFGRAIHQLLMVSSQATTKLLTDDFCELEQSSLCNTSILLPCQLCVWAEAGLLRWAGQRGLLIKSNAGQLLAKQLSQRVSSIKWSDSLQSSNPSVSSLVIKNKGAWTLGLMY